MPMQTTPTASSDVGVEGLKYWLGAFVRWDSLNGAVFADSPLVKSENYFAAGVGIAWIFRKSSTLVEAEE
jgi:hypothetical protein